MPGDSQLHCQTHRADGVGNLLTRPREIPDIAPDTLHLIRPSLRSPQGGQDGEHFVVQDGRGDPFRIKGMERPGRVGKFPLDQEEGDNGGIDDDHLPSLLIRASSGLLSLTGDS